MIEKLEDISDHLDIGGPSNQLIRQNRDKLNEIIEHLNKEPCNQCEGTGIFIETGEPKICPKCNRDFYLKAEKQAEQFDQKIKRERPDGD